jgi:hypothetical protein
VRRIICPWASPTDAVQTATKRDAGTLRATISALDGIVVQVGVMSTYTYASTDYDDILTALRTALANNGAIPGSGCI